MQTYALLAVLVVLPCAACAASEASAPPDPYADPPATTTDEVTKGTTFTCTVDTPRLGQYDSQRFASLKLVISGKTATIKAVAFTADYANEMKQGNTNEEAFLARGLDYDGRTPLTAEQRASAQARIDKVKKILAADGTLSFAGEVKPYTRQPKKPTIQYPIEPTTAGIDAETLWDTLGNEGSGARILLPPAMGTGADGHPDIEWEGSQGPLWDRYNCEK